MGTHLHMLTHTHIKSATITIIWKHSSPHVYTLLLKVLLVHKPHQFPCQWNPLHLEHPRLFLLWSHRHPVAKLQIKDNSVTCKTKLIVDFHNFAKAPYLKMFLRNDTDFSTRARSCTSTHIFSNEENLQLKNAYFTKVASEQPAGLYRRTSLHIHRNRHIIKNCSLHNLCVTQYQSVLLSFQTLWQDRMLVPLLWWVRSVPLYDEIQMLQYE